MTETTRVARIAPALGFEPLGGGRIIKLAPAGTR